jgi:hypothetical protein
MKEKPNAKNIQILFFFSGKNKSQTLTVSVKKKPYQKNSKKIHDIQDLKFLINLIIFFF